MSWTYIFRFLIKPIGFVVVWFAILRLYGVGLNFGSPNFNLNYFVMILILEPPSNNTNSIVFFPIYTWIIAIWLFIVIVIVLTYDIEKTTCLFVVALLKLWVFFLVLIFATNIYLIQELFKTIVPSSNYKPFEPMLRTFVMNLYYC